MTRSEGLASDSTTDDEDSAGSRAAFTPNWQAWEQLIDEHGIEIDRPKGSIHPMWPEITYPIDYGFIRDTLGTDGDELDIFVGTASNGLVAAILTMDHRRGDRECKLLYNCSPEEIYLVHGFANFEPAKFEGRMVMRRPMRELFGSGMQPRQGAG
jgi:inorganic pyrophosphatase